MKLIKALNNNVALVKDRNGQEAVVMGRGVAFGCKPGDPVREALVEKHFVLNGDNGKKDFDLPDLYWRYGSGTAQVGVLRRESGSHAAPGGLVCGGGNP